MTTTRKGGGYESGPKPATGVPPVPPLFKRNGSAPDPNQLTLEQKVDMLIWLHSELSARCVNLAGAVAAMLAQQMQPQMQQAIMEKLLTGAQP